MYKFILHCKFVSLRDPRVCYFVFLYCKPNKKNVILLFQLFMPVLFRLSELKRVFSALSLLFCVSLVSIFVRGFVCVAIRRSQNDSHAKRAEIVGTGKHEQQNVCGAVECVWMPLVVVAVFVYCTKTNRDRDTYTRTQSGHPSTFHVHTDGAWIALYYKWRRYRVDEY